MALSNVDLPAPLAPITVTIAPLGTCSSGQSNAGTVPYWTLRSRTVIKFSCVLMSFLPRPPDKPPARSEEHTSELQSRGHLVCRLLLEKKHTKAVIISLRNYDC